MLRNSDHLTTTTDVWDERLRLTHPGQANWADKPTPIKNKETGEVTMQDTALVSPITKPGEQKKMPKKLMREFGTDDSEDPRVFWD